MKTRITKTKASTKAKNKSKKLEMLNDQLSQPQPVYFWHADGDDGYLGQWYQSPFTWLRPIDGTDGEEFEELVYQIAEQYIMHRKALLFAPDSPITAQILAAGQPAPHPHQLKKLGRQVSGFSDEVWKREGYGIVLQGNLLKFSQNSELKEKLLLATGDRELVEASPLDRIW